MTDQWFTERHTPHAGLTLEFGARLFDAQSAYQHVEVLDTREFGRMLLLDGCVMLTERDEFIYHEMIAHVPLFAHGAARDVLIVGGGDGGTLRECLRHTALRSVTLVEIDGMVLDVSRRFFPEVAAGLDDPRARIVVGDGFDHLQQSAHSYDVILVDSIDPVGAAVKLFGPEFHALVARALRPGGVAALQTESPFYHLPVLRDSCDSLGTQFAHVAPYLANIPTYPAGVWSFTFASNDVDPRTAIPTFEAEFLAGLNYFSPEIFRAAFALPRYIRRGLES
ncbi:MAG: polyamine aminopropyltransferase [Candidatus Lambdaproteobacteria bacterium]|nr:polyamine aminopropyltransferase [Candidatus Lambdaproteobacteria bacterium]